jgi:CBS domain-containing protein
MRATDVTVAPDSTLEQAMCLMRDHGMDLIPVCDSSRNIMGTITDRDIAIRVVTEGLDARRTDVRLVMGKVSFQCFEYQPVEDVCRTMVQNDVTSALVLDRQGNFAGVLSLPQVAAKGLAINGNSVTPQAGLVMRAGNRRPG